jgi:hypothetical protein
MPSFSKQASSPTKLAEYLAMGLPCECNSGVGDVDRIMAEVESLRGETDKLISYARNHFSLKNGVKAYAEVLETSFKS